MSDLMAIIVIVDPGAIVLLMGVSFCLSIGTTLPLMKPVLRWKTLGVLLGLWVVWAVVTLLVVQGLRGQPVIELETIKIP